MWNEDEHVMSDKDRSLHCAFLFQATPAWSTILFSPFVPGTLFRFGLHFLTSHSSIAHPFLSTVVYRVP